MSSQKMKRHFSQVLPIAEKVIDRLAPACVRVEIAGSLRRKSQFVGDIEIMCIPIIKKDLWQ